MFSQTHHGSAKLKALARRFSGRRAARQTLFAFSRLDDRALKDIGLCRFELPHAASHSLLWRWPR